MILTERIITVNGNISTLDAPIYLYQGDKNVDIYFSIVNPKYKFSKKVVDNLLGETAAYFDLYIIKPDGSQVSFKNQAIEDKKAKWTIESELIDEEIEIGKYDFQIRLLDENKTSILTIPPLLGQLEILKPIYTDSDTPSNNLVNLAATNYALATSGNNDVVVFDEDGNYVATVWTDKMKITDTLLNKIETAIKQNTAQYKDIANKIESGNIGINIEPLDNDIPKVFFYGDISTMSKATSVDLNFEYKSKTATYKGVATTKWQGSSSLSFPKKNYTIKLFTDSTKSKKLKLNMKNWGKQSKFCLKANWIDTLHIRNISGARIAYDMIKSRSDFSSLPTELQQAPRCGVIDGFPIKVYMNGELIGLYTWNIPKDKWCSNMDDTNPNHAFLMAEKNNGGVLTDNHILACEFRANATIFADTSNAQYPDYDWVVEGPGDDVSVDIRTSFNNLINCVKDTDDATFKSTISNYLDLTSAFDYYCFAYLVCHYDGLGKNLGMATYDGTKWFCTLYDMDSIYGAKIDGSGYLETNRKCPEQYQETNSLLWQRIEKCFGQELYTRYKELRQGALSLGNIFTHVEEIYDSIPDRLYTEDREKWTSIPSVDTNTIKRMRDYMVARATYVDGEMKVIGTPKVACTNITLNTTALSFTTTAAQTLTATLTPTNTTDIVSWSVSPGGICTINNGVVKPIKNGECVVTATCGSKSATCNVTVSGIEEQPIPNDLLVKLDSSSLTNSSTTWEDLSGNGVNFTLSNGTLNVSDKGLLMNSIKATGIKPITLNGAFTAYYCVNVSVNLTPAFCSFNINNSTKYCDSTDSTKLKINGYSGDTITTAVIKNPDKLQKIAIVHPSEGNTQVYLNGVLQGTYNRGTFAASGTYDLVLGASSYSNFVTSASNYTIKELQIFNRALSAEEAKKLTDDGSHANDTTLTKTLTLGKGLDKNTGELTDANANYGTCEEYIPVIKGNTYNIKACGSWICVCGYNSDKTFNKLITGGSVSATTYQFTNDYDYIRIGCTCTTENTTITITGVFDK